MSLSCWSLLVGDFGNLIAMSLGAQEKYLKEAAQELGQARAALGRWAGRPVCPIGIGKVDMWRVDKPTAMCLYAFFSRSIYVSYLYNLYTQPKAWLLYNLLTQTSYHGKKSRYLPWLNGNNYPWKPTNDSWMAAMAIRQNQPSKQ